MSVNTGLTRLGKVIDWACMALSAAMCGGLIWAVLFNSAVFLDVLPLFIAPGLLIAFGKTARYVINGFAA